MQTFGWSEQHVCEEITGAQGWAYYTWAVENRAILFGSEIQRASLGYVAQEIKRLKNNESR